MSTRYDTPSRDVILKRKLGSTIYSKMNGQSNDKENMVIRKRLNKSRMAEKPVELTTKTVYDYFQKKSQETTFILIDGCASMGMNVVAEKLAEIFKEAKVFDMEAMYQEALKKADDSCSAYDRMCDWAQEACYDAYMANHSFIMVTNGMLKNSYIERNIMMYAMTSKFARTMSVLCFDSDTRRYFDNLQKYTAQKGLKDEKARNFYNIESSMYWDIDKKLNSPCRDVYFSSGFNDWGILDIPTIESLK